MDKIILQHDGIDQCNQIAHENGALTIQLAGIVYLYSNEYAWVSSSPLVFVPGMYPLLPIRSVLQCLQYVKTLKIFLIGSSKSQIFLIRRMADDMLRMNISIPAKYCVGEINP